MTFIREFWAETKTHPWRRLFSLLATWAVIMAASYFIDQEIPLGSMRFTCADATVAAVLAPGDKSRQVGVRTSKGWIGATPRELTGDYLLRVKLADGSVYPVEQTSAQYASLKPGDPGAASRADGLAASGGRPLSKCIIRVDFVAAAAEPQESRAGLSALAPERQSSTRAKPQAAARSAIQPRNNRRNHERKTYATNRKLPA